MFDFANYSLRNFFNVVEESELREKNAIWFLSIIIQSYIHQRRTSKTLLAKLFK